MTQSELKANIRAKFKAEIADVHNLTTIYDNKSHKGSSSELWCRLTIKTASTNQASLGGVGDRRYRKRGVMIAQLFVKAGTGDKTIDDMAGHIENAFRGITTNNVNYETPEINDIGLRENNYQVNVNCPFFIDNIG